MSTWKQIIIENTTHQTMQECLLQQSFLNFKNCQWLLKYTFSMNKYKTVKQQTKHATFKLWNKIKAQNNKNNNKRTTALFMLQQPLNDMNTNCRQESWIRFFLFHRTSVTAWFLQTCGHVFWGLFLKYDVTEAGVFVFSLFLSKY